MNKALDTNINHNYNPSPATLSIIVRIENVYGIERVYPVCETAHHFAVINGNKTLSQSTLNAIENIGYTIEVEPVHLSSYKLSTLAQFI